MVPDLTPTGDSQARRLLESAVKIVYKKWCDVRDSKRWSFTDLRQWPNTRGCHGVCSVHHLFLVAQLWRLTEGPRGDAPPAGSNSPQPPMIWSQMANVIEGGGKMKPGAAAPKWWHSATKTLSDGTPSEE